MQIEETELSGVKLITPKQFGDHRGHFSETYNAKTYEQIGIAQTFIQDNQSFSASKGTVRALHLQLPPFAQAKLVRVLRGAILDVAVDLRKESPTYLKYAKFVLSAENRTQAIIPEGFAHGFCTLEPDTEVFYKVNNLYSVAHERGIRWNDPAVGIDWPVSETDAILSDKDKAAPYLSEIPELA